MKKSLNRRTWCFYLVFMVVTDSLLTRAGLAIFFFLSQMKVLTSITVFACLVIRLPCYLPQDWWSSIIIDWMPRECVPIIILIIIPQIIVGTKSTLNREHNHCLSHRLYQATAMSMFRSSLLYQTLTLSTDTSLQFKPTFRFFHLLMVSLGISRSTSSPLPPSFLLPSQ